MQETFGLAQIKAHRHRTSQIPLANQPKQNKRSQRSRQIILNYLYQVKWALGLAALSMLGFTATELLAPWPLKIIFDYILLDKSLPPALVILGWLFQAGKILPLLTFASAIALIAVLSSAFAYLQIYLTSRIGYELVYTLRRELFVHLQRLSLSFHNRARRGEILTKVASDTNTLREVFAESPLELITNFLTIIGMFIVMFVLNWQLSLVVLVTFPALFLVLLQLKRKLKISVRQQRKQEGKIVSQISETLGAIPLVQAFGREAYEAKRFDTESAQNLAEGIRIARLDAAVTRTVTIISAAGLSAVVLFGAWQALKGQMSPGDVLVFATYVKSLYKPIGKVAKLLTQVSKATVSAQRIAEILDIQPEIRDKPNAIKAANLRGEITFQNVSFHYDEHGQETLKNVSFTISPGQRVALVGASGAGKSTIASLILRLYDPQAGSILIDGIDIKDYQRQSLRHQIGLVLQDATLFGATIRENISYGKPSATQAEIERAAQQAYAHDFIMALPEGYDSVIGENGCTLSGGQRQRLCLARALVKQPPILILDEPTSSLDAESEALVQDTINCLQQGKTILVIAHHLTAIKDFDQILVLKEGEIVERGTHADLMARRGYYYELFQLQNLQPGHTFAAEPANGAMHPVENKTAGTALPLWWMDQRQKARNLKLAPVKLISSIED